MNRPPAILFARRRREKPASRINPR